MSKDIDSKYQQQLKAVGFYLRELRLNSNQTQQELGNDILLHRNSISRAENGSNITLQTLFQLAEYLNVSPSEVLSIIDEL